MLQIRNLSKHFGDKAVVKDLSFQVEKGQILVLLGKSGSGKTTTLKMINRLIEPSGGEILIEGRNVMKSPPEELRRNIGYVIQDNGLFPHYTVAENVALVPRLLKWDKKRQEAQTHRMLSMLDLDPDEYGPKAPSELSGGQQQRVAIARALAAEAPLLLMDEPFSALDPITRVRARAKFEALIRELKTTVVMVTHDVVEAVDLGDQIALMENGLLAQLGSPDELLLNPKSDFVHHFFDGNRMELELRSIKLEVVIPFLQMDSTNIHRPDEFIEADARDSLLEVLEKMAATNSSLILLPDLGTTSREDLLKSYFLWKKHLESKN